MTATAGATQTAPSTINRKERAVGNHKVRTTIEPDKVLEVDDAEFVDLERLGLIKSDETDKKEKA